MNINIGTILKFKVGEWKGKTVRVVNIDFNGITTADIYDVYSTTVGYYIAKENISSVFNISN